MASKNRLIDVNALGIGKAKREAFDNPAYADGWNSAIAIIESAPIVDAVEVVHSQWDTVFYERNRTLASYSHICPECKYFYRDLRFKGHNYCPNCGAKMDGDGNG